MKVLALNASPRKNWNTAQLLTHALKGASSAGAETELIHLYPLQYKGCSSCFSCKRLGSASYGQCALKDQLTPILEKAINADALLLGSPVYLGVADACMQAFIERFLYPYITYSAGSACLAPKQMPVGFIYTFGATAARIQQMGYDHCARLHEAFIKKVFGHYESLHVINTYQFDDYAKYETSGIDVAMKERVKKEQWPKDCENAYQLGTRLVELAKGQ